MKKSCLIVLVLCSWSEVSHGLDREQQRGKACSRPIAARVFATISDINVSLISQGASRVNLTFVVDEGRVREAVLRLHEALFERHRSRPSMLATPINVTPPLKPRYLIQRLPAG